MLALLILVPLLALLVVNLPVGDFLRRQAPWLVLLLAAVQVALVLAGSPEFFAGSGEFLNVVNIKLILAADGLSKVMLLSIGLVVAVGVLVAQGTLADDRQKFLFANLLLLASLGMNGTVLLRDLFSLYVFLEITAVASFIMIAMDRKTSGLEGAFKYLILSAVASVAMLSGVALLLLFVNNLSFMAIGAASHGQTLVKLAIAIFLVGLFIKGGVMPFHGWLPGAYSAAPAAVSVVLAGIITKVSGIYTLIRLGRDVFGVTLDTIRGVDPAVGQVLLAVGAISIVLGALAALRQSDFKRMLAYSSISQVGYIVLGLGCGTELAIFGAIFHLLNHAIFKSLLFVNSAAVEHRLGTTDLAALGGMGGKMPITSWTSVIASLSTAGVPPLSGFWSKLIIIVALWQAHHEAYAVVAVLASVLTLAYFLLLQRRVFFGTPSDALAAVKEAPAGVVVAELLLAGVTLAIGVGFPFVAKAFSLPMP